MAADINVHAGHRARMRKKLQLHTAKVFDTYEILEMLLYYVVRKRDTNPLSKALLSRFGSIEGVMSASAEQLMEVDGVGPSVARFIRDVAEYGDLLLSDSGDKVALALDDYRKAGEFFVDYFSSLSEQERMLTVMVSLDNRMNVIATDVVYELDFSSGKIQDKRFVELALENRAAAVILAHNHPFGAALPNEGDRATNAYISRSLATCGVILAEHYVVAGKRYVGFMNHLPSAFSQLPELNGFIRSKMGVCDDKRI